MTTSTRKVLFFIVGNEPTVTEQGLIDRIVGNVQIRTNTQSAQYGANLESAAAIAGTPPTAYTTAIANYPDGNVTPSLLAKPEGLTIVSSTGTMGLAAGTLNLRAVKAELDETTGVVTISDVTTTCVWTSSDVTKATVGAATGVVTKVAAGATNITASFDYDGAGSLAPVTNVVALTVT